MSQEIDDITQNVTKKIKSKPKGNRVELELAKALNKRFAELLSENPKWGRFSRSVGSGNRWGQNVFLSESAKQTYSGDLVCPPKFKFVIESKGGYNDYDLFTAFNGGHKEVDKFLKQVEDDGNRCNRQPMLVWKKDYKERVVFIKEKNIKTKESFDYYMLYRDWVIVPFSALFEFDDSFFFDK